MSLLTSLVAAWEFDGDATDAHGANDLTLFNSPAYGTGVVNAQALDLELSSSQYATIADNADVSTGDIDFTVEVWFKAESLPDYSRLFTKDSAGSNREFGVYFITGIPVWETSWDGSNTSGLAWGSALSTGQWYQLVVWHDAANNRRGISINAGTPATDSYSTGVFNSTAPFQVGAGTAFGGYFDGLVGPVRMWKRVLTTGERAELYNAGAGLPYAGLSMGAALWNKAKAVWEAGTRTLTTGSSPSTAGLTLWLKADGTLWQDSARTTPATADGDPVGAWDDASGNANHHTQATSGNRPLLKTSIVNGRPVLRFDGSNDCLDYALTTGTNATLFVVVANQRAGTISGVDCVYATQSAGNNGIAIDTANAFASSTQRQFIGEASGGTAVTYKNGATSPLTLSLGEFAIGTHKITGGTGRTASRVGGFTTGTYFGQNDIAEILLYDSALSDADRERVEAYLRIKYFGNRQEEYAQAVWEYSPRTLTSAAGYTGTSAVVVAEVTAAASGTFTAPAYVATGAPSTDAATSSLSGTHTAPVYAATGSPSTDAAAASLSGTHTAPNYSATGTPSTDAAVGAIAGTHTAPVYAATGTPSAAEAVAAASGAMTAVGYSGIGSPSTNAAVAAGTGTHTAPIYAATGSPSADAATAAASGTNVAYVGAGAADTVAAVAALSGTHTAPIYAATGTPAVATVVAALSGAHTAPIYAAAGSPSADAATAAGSAVMTAAGYNGIGAPAVPEATAAAAGTHTAPIYAGTSTASTDAATAALSGAHTAPIYAGTATLTAGPATSSAAGLLVFVGSGAGSTVAAASEAAGTSLFLGGSAAVSAEAAGASAAGSVTVPIYTGTAAATVTAAASAASGLSFSGIFFSADLTTDAAVAAAGGGFLVARYRGGFPQLRVGERLVHLPRGARVPRATVGFAFRTAGTLSYVSARHLAPAETPVAAGSVLRTRAVRVDWGRTTAYVEAVVRDRTFGSPEFT